MDKIKTGSLITNAVLLLTVLILLRFVGCGHKETPCTEVSRQTDTIKSFIDRTDTLYKTIAVYVPKPVKVLSGNQQDHIPSVTDCPMASPTDTLLYSDSLYCTHEFKAVITDTVLGRILGRSVQWADLTPIEQQIITHTITVEEKQALVKVYLGADASVRYASPLSKGGLDIAPATSILFADRYMLDVGYFILGGEFTAGMKVKLSFKRK